MSNNEILVLAADDTTAVALVATIRSATNGVGKYADYVEAHDVTRDTVKVHALALANLAYPSLAGTAQKTDGKRTKFGNAVQAAGNGLRGALGKIESSEEEEEEEDTAPVLRVTLSGDGGGKAVIEEDHPLYGQIIDLIRAGQ